MTTINNAMIKKQLILIVILFSYQSLALEELSLSNNARWTFDVFNLVQSGHALEGKKIINKEKCANCHGDNGISDEDDTPSLAGQEAAYTFKQLYDYRHKIRNERTMYKKVKKLTYQQMSDIAAWYASQKPEQKVGIKPPILAAKGDTKRFLIACDMCHSKTIMPGGFQVPIIAGQKIEYLYDTLDEFREGDRENDAYQIMQNIVQKLTDEEIKELVDYYAALASKE